VESATVTVVPLDWVTSAIVRMAPASKASVPAVKATVPAPARVPEKLLPVPVRVILSVLETDRVPPVWSQTPA
jgi:hypothetical protein